MKKITKFKKNKKKSFTIVEMIVSVSIFMIIITISSNFFISAIRTQQRILANQQIISQTSYALDDMSRALRMARKDTSGDCISPNTNYKKTENGIEFKDYKGNCRKFFLDPDNKQIKQKLEGETLPLTYSNLEIVDFNINLRGEAQGDNLQPRITLFLKVKKTGQKTTKQFQTSISQRNLDILK